ncbi:efflux RND transporter periplasmic adaptor subunit [Hyphobacterium sp.]|uniref:efflux RND transporter periplasmic adaptor subunit n=1 Tax=Hyphobacterium sp. TaxID=2004662 RepID=UPI003B51E7B1
MSRAFLPLIMIAGLLTACSSETVENNPSPRLVQVETVAGIGPDRHYEFVGRVEAARSVDLSFQVNGQLAELPVTDGIEVAEGDLIAQLDLEDFQRAEREARVQLQQARTDLDRQQTLFDRGIASAAARDNAQTQYDLRLVALENARRNLENATLRAPFDGLISRVLVENFTVVPPGQPIARLQDVSELRVSIPLSEDLIATFTPDELLSVEASFAFLPGQRFTLTPRELISEPDAASQTYRGVLALPGEIPANILPGMTATVYAEFSPDADLPNAVHIPVNALAYDADGEPAVFVFDENTGQVQFRPIDVAGINEGRVQVVSGLAPGDEIVTAGVHSLQDGMAVRPLTEQP